MSFPRGTERLGRTTELVVFHDPIASGALAGQVPDAGLGWVAAVIGVVSQILPMFGSHPDPNSASQVIARMTAAATMAGDDNARNDFVAHLLGGYRRASDGAWIDQTDGTHFMPDQALMRVHEILEHGSTGDFFPSPDQYNTLAHLAVAAGVAQQTAGGATPAPATTSPFAGIINALNPPATVPGSYPTGLPYRPSVTTAGLSSSTLTLGLIGALVIGGIMLSDKKGRRR